MAADRKNGSEAGFHCTRSQEWEMSQSNFS
jgi:hypothetical protein